MAYSNDAFDIDRLEATVALLEERLAMVVAYLDGANDCAVGYGLSAVGVVTLRNIATGQWEA